jgi:uncharacterized protein (TIGR02147 family)
MQNHWEAQNTSEFLGFYYNQKKSRNQAYSMRAFARDIGISPSRLSEVMSGKERISEKSGIIVADNLKLKAKTKEYWLNLVLAEIGGTELVRKTAQARLEDLRKVQSYKFIQNEQLEMISGWQHGALLEMLDLDDVPHDASEFAKRLDITTSQCEDSLRRLENLKFIKKDKDRWVTTFDLAVSMADVPSMAVRKFHRQIMDKGITSIMEDDVADRELNSVVLAVAKSRMPEFKNAIRKFFGEFITQRGDDPKDELYALSVQFFPVTKKKRK